MGEGRKVDGHFKLCEEE